MSSSAIRATLSVIVALAALCLVLLKLDLVPGFHLPGVSGGARGTSGQGSGSGAGAGGGAGGGSSGEAATGQDPDELRLCGISSSAKQRLAIVNNETMAVGESIQMSRKGESVKVLCKEIRAHSVILEVEGGPSALEIFLADEVIRHLGGPAGSLRNARP